MANSFEVIEAEVNEAVVHIENGFEFIGSGITPQDKLDQIRTRINNLRKSSGSVANYPWNSLLDIIHQHIPKIVREWRSPERIALDAAEEAMRLEEGLRASIDGARGASNSFGW